MHLVTDLKAEQTAPIIDAVLNLWLLEDWLTDCIRQTSRLHICSLHDREQRLAGGTDICHHWCHWHRQHGSHKSCALLKGT